MAKIKGTKRDEILEGTNFNDSIFGMAGNDRLFGHRGHDLLDGGDGNDTMRGGMGNDTLLGGAGNDRILGDEGDDRMAGGAGADTFVHRPGEGFDTIAADDYDNKDLVLLAGADYYDINFWWDGNDLQLAAAVDDNYDFNETGMVTLKNFFNGGPGYVTAQIDVLDANTFYGSDPELSTLRFERGLTGIHNVGYAEVIRGTAGNDVITGNGGYYDGLYGLEGNDIINGGDNEPGGRDQMRGGAGDDVLNGFGGDDRMRGDAGNDFLDGGDGVDEARYDRAAAGVWVVLDSMAFDDGEGGQDMLLNMENLRGSAFSDILVGSNFVDNRIQAGGGDDFMLGLSGDDFLWGQGGADTAAFETFSDGNDYLFEFDGGQDKLAFHDLLDVGKDGILDDLQAQIDSVLDFGAGFDVLVTLTSGSTLTFGGAGTGAITDIAQLFADPASQITTF